MKNENQTSDSARVVLAVAQHKGCTSKEVKLIEHTVRTLVVQDSSIGRHCILHRVLSNRVRTPYGCRGGCHTYSSVEIDA